MNFNEHIINAATIPLDESKLTTNEIGTALPHHYTGDAGGNGIVDCAVHRIDGINPMDSRQICSARAS